VTGREQRVVVALFGPTALGKSAIAVELAASIGAEIVVADSMQVYRGVPLLTNQPDAAMRRRVRYHLTGVADPYAEFSVAAYSRLAHAAVDDALGRGPVLIEGGSGLYLRAALATLDFGPAGDPSLRADLEARWRRDPAEVVGELRRLDPGAAARVDLANPRRVVRALEAAHAGGGPRRLEADDLWSPPGRRPYVLYGLLPDRTALRARIAARVDAMLARGALEEVDDLLAGGAPSRTLGQAIGVAELSAVLSGELDPTAARERMIARTNRLVRRQLTWMRKLPAHALVETAGRSPADVARELAAGLW
jgi:tRNA dimethylallyltransferase